MPLSLLAASNFALLLYPSCGSNLAGLLATAWCQPGRLNYASAHFGIPRHMLIELMKQLAGIDVSHVPDRAIADAMNDPLGG